MKIFTIIYLDINYPYLSVFIRNSTSLQTVACVVVLYCKYSRFILGKFDTVLYLYYEIWENKRDG